MMKLFYSPTSPFVRKVMVAAIELGLDKRIEVLPTNPWEQNDALWANNPLSKIPTLVGDDGEVYYDSAVICEYLDSLHAGPRLIPQSGPARWQVLRMQALADGLADAAVLRMMERKRPAAQRSPDWDALQVSAIQRALQAMQAQLPAAASVAVPDLGAIASACALGYLDLRFQDEDWRTGQPRLSEWYATFSTRPSMQKTRPAA